jgi:hypothetical protein
MWPLAGEKLLDGNISPSSFHFQPAEYLSFHCFPCKSVSGNVKANMSDSLYIIIHPQQRKQIESRNPSQENFQKIASRFSVSKKIVGKAKIVEHNVPSKACRPSGVICIICHNVPLADFRPFFEPAHQ